MKTGIRATHITEKVGVAGTSYTLTGWNTPSITLTITNLSPMFPEIQKLVLSSPWGFLDFTRALA